MECALCALADAAEVQKWATVAGALMSTDFRPLLVRCARVVWRHEARPCELLSVADYSEVETLAEDLRSALFPEGPE